MTSGFKLIGISIRTTNKDNQSAQDLGKLWERFHSENIFEKIPDKISSEIYSVYTDYKSNYTEDYTTIIGAPVSSLDDIPEGLVGRQFDDENFLKFTAKGDMPDALLNTWLSIWRDDKELNRKYSYDYEVHGPKCQNGKDSEVEVFLSVK